jgi:hypothetical protein
MCAEGFLRRDLLNSETVEQLEPKAVDVPVALEAESHKADETEEVVTASAEASVSQPSNDAAVEIPEADDAGKKRSSGGIDDSSASKALKAEE